MGTRRGEVHVPAVSALALSLSPFVKGSRHPHLPRNRPILGTTIMQAFSRLPFAEVVDSARFADAAESSRRPESARKRLPLGCRE